MLPPSRTFFFENKFGTLRQVSPPPPQPGAGGSASGSQCRSLGEAGRRRLLARDLPSPPLRRDPPPATPSVLVGRAGIDRVGSEAELSR